MADYLETGIKQGRTQTRDELDRRVILSGNLREVAQTIDDMHTKDPNAERYVELVFSFQEQDLDDATLRAIDAEIQSFLLGGYAPGEISYYSEAHMPKVMQEVDKFGEIKPRNGHIHAFLPKVNNFTGKRENPLGMLEMKYGNEKTGNDLVSALQEHINHKFGLTSPKDIEHRRTDFTRRAEILAKHDGQDFSGRNRDWQQTIRDRMIAERIETVEAFDKMVRTIGTVRYGLEGTDKQYLKFKPFNGGDGKNVRLDNWQFSAEFITMPTAAKLEKINEIRVAKYYERQPPRPTPEQAIEDMAKFRQWQDTARFLHNGSPDYKAYQAANQEGKLEILAGKRAEHYTKINSGLVDKVTPEQAAALEHEHKSAYELSFEEMLLAEFPNRRLNSTHYRTMDQIYAAQDAGNVIIADPETVFDELNFSQSTITQKDLERHLLKNTADSEQFDLAMQAVLNYKGLVIRQDEKGRTTFTTKEIATIEKSLVDRVERLAAKTDKRAEIDKHLASPEYKAEAAAREARAKANPPTLSLLAKISQFVFGESVESLHGAQSIHGIPVLHESESDRIAREVKATKSMNDGQGRAYDMLVSDRKIGVVNGSPGSGKSYILAALREAEELNGNTVYGAVLQGKTGEDLMSDSGINTTTLHSLLFKLNKGYLKLDSKSIVVIDEAGMVGSRQLENLLEHIEKSGARLRLVGDTFQLHAVEFGAAFKAISERCDVVSLTEIMRQATGFKRAGDAQNKTPLRAGDEIIFTADSKKLGVSNGTTGTVLSTNKEDRTVEVLLNNGTTIQFNSVGWQRAASEQLSRHEIAAPLQAYFDNGNIHFAENAAEQQALIVEKWNKLRIEKPNESCIVLVGTNNERNKLNVLMREEIKKDGGLQNEVDVQTASGVKPMAVGEKIMFVASDKDLDVKNGTSGVIDFIDKKGNITITTDKGVKVTIRADGKDTDTGNKIDYAYASTIHKAQGMTVDHALALPSLNMALENLLVAFTRHKQSLEIVCNKEQFADLSSLTAQLDKSGRKDFSYDPEQAEWQSARKADTQIQQYKADFAHDKIIQRTAEQAQFKEMNTSIDARLLIDRLAASHGIDPSIFGITKKDGQDMIQCGSRTLSASDFLTKELHMDFKSEALPILREVYAAQLEKTYAPMRDAQAMSGDQVINRQEVNKPVWQEFQAYKDAQAEQYKTKSAEITDEQRSRRNVVSDIARLAIEALKKRIIKPQALKKERQKIKATRDADLKVIRQEASDRRGALMQEYKRPQAEQYKDYLAEYAPVSDRHLQELKRVSFTPADRDRLAAIEAARAAEQVRVKESFESDIKAAQERIQQAAERTAKEAEQRALAEARRQEREAKEAALQAEQTAAQGKAPDIEEQQQDALTASDRELIRRTEKAILDRNYRELKVCGKQIDAEGKKLIKTIESTKGTPEHARHLERHLALEPLRALEKQRQELQLELSRDHGMGF